MLYWDNPVGTGYSYNTQGSSDCYVGNERDMAAQFVNALQAFYQRHPEYASNPLYLAGESYAGKYLPYIALEITYRNLFASNGVIPLRGMAIGDGWMIPARQCEDQVRYAALLGILDTNQVNKVQQICDRIERCLTQGDYVSAKKLDDELMAKLSACGGGMDLYDVRQFGDIEVAPLSAYLNSAAVKKCFNVPSNVNWQCSDESGPVSDALVEDIMQSVAELVPLLVDYPKTAAQIVAWHDQDEVRPTRLAATSAAKYKLLFYTGTFDLSCGFSGSEQLLRSMSWSGQQLWSGLSRGVWYAENGSGNKVTQGYIKQADNLTQIEIPDAGHMIPLSQPAINRDMIYRWIEDSGFPSYDPLAES
jgi:vitellogenic carboxypeptidase-like protein